jgi:uncharacterized protein YjbJ (UPF0337 family)
MEITGEATVVKPSTKDEVAGTLQVVKGSVKKNAGKLAKDPELETQGEAEEIRGKVRKKIGQVKKVLGA